MKMISDSNNNSLIMPQALLSALHKLTHCGNPLTDSAAYFIKSE